MLSDKLEKILDENLASLSSLEDDMSMQLGGQATAPAGIVSEPTVPKPAVSDKVPPAQVALESLELEHAVPEPNVPTPARVSPARSRPAPVGAAPRTTSPEPSASSGKRPRVKLSAKFRRLLSGNHAIVSVVESNILSAAKGKEIKTLFLTSCRRKEGKTTAAVAIAHALASSTGARVVLVEGNLTHPGLHKAFTCRQAPGITDYLLSRADLEDVLQETEHDGLWIIPHGSDVANASNALSPRVLSGRLAVLRSKFDYVIVDGNAVLSSSNAATLARLFDGIVLVVECRKTKWEVLEVAREKIMNVGGDVLGVVLNKRQHYIPSGLYSRV